MHRANVRTHSRRTASGGTTTVHQHSKSYRHSGARSRRSYRRAVRRQGFGVPQPRKRRPKRRRNLAGRGWDNTKRAFWTWGPGKRRKAVAVVLGVLAVGQVTTYVGLQGLGGVATAVGVLGIGIGILARRGANVSRGDS